MKKANKSYHLEQSKVSRRSSSPGRILKNQGKVNKQKTLQKHNGSISHPKKQDLEEINKKVQQHLSRTKNQKFIEKYGQNSTSGTRQEKGEFITGQKQQKLVQENAANSYEQIYQNDMRYFRDYLSSTGKYQFNGINLNWPYYFSKNNFQHN